MTTFNLNQVSDSAALITSEEHFIIFNLFCFNSPERFSDPPQIHRFIRHAINVYVWVCETHLDQQVDWSVEVSDSVSTNHSG